MTTTNTVQAFHFNNEELIAEAVKNNEGIIASNGAFSATTGARTGRSPNDRFIVDEPTTSDLIDSPSIPGVCTGAATTGIWPWCSGRQRC